MTLARPLIPRFLLTAGLALAGLATAHGGPADLARGVTAYLPLDGDCTPRWARGSAAVKGDGLTYTDGRAGKAAVVSAAGIGVPGAGNFSRPVGSLAFWVRPEWTPDDPAYTGDRSLFASDNFILNYHRPKHVLFFMTGTSKQDEGYRWDYGCADDRQVAGWKPGEWHHVAATWDSATGQKALYLDGRPASRSTTEWIRSDAFTTAGSVTLGGQHAPGAYDELVLWGRVLSPDEVALLAAQPQEVARALGGGLPQRRARAGWPVEFGIYTVEPEDAASTIVEPGAAFAARITARNPGTAPWKGRVTFTLLDFWQRSRATHRMALSLRPGERRVLRIAFRAPECGVFKVAVAIDVRGARSPAAGARVGTATVGSRASGIVSPATRDVASFAAWPVPKGRPDPGSFFGHHVNSWSEGIVAQAARLGLAWNRGHNMLQFTWWPRVQPEPGEFAWSYQFHRERMKRHRIHSLGQFFGTPYWATADGKPLAKQGPDDYPYPARPNLEAFRRYVFETVKHHPEVRFWEVWNEPEVSLFWNGSPEEYAELCRAAYDAAHQADPRVVVMNGGYTVSAWKWHESAAQAGALKHADAVSCHLYYGATQPPEELYRHLSQTVGHFRALAREHGGRELPVWDTEGGSEDTTWLRGFESPDLPAPELRTPMNWRDASLAAVQSAAMLQSLGVVRSFQYLWNPSGPGTYEGPSALDMTNAPKPRLMARIAMAAQVEGARCAGTVRRAEGRLWASVYAKGNASVVLWWAGRGGKVRVAAPWRGKAVKAVDLMGNHRPVAGTLEVGEEPSYLHLTAPAGGVLRALRQARVVVLHRPAALARKQAARPRKP